MFSLDPGITMFYIGCQCCMTNPDIQTGCQCCWTNYDVHCGCSVVRLILLSRLDAVSSDIQTGCSVVILILISKLGIVL